VSEMALERNRIELERLTNLISGFGWKLVEQKFTDDKIIVTVEKSRGPGVEVPEAEAG